ncbi:MAG TPA: DNA adenine methylase [Bacteroidales bacterium]|jgi:DNA adenine methylase|nr:DNA adenine methylase [Bacteroidales bacterium]HOF07995.1 DNA adenine methylase [Bacteroidales bacterium]HPL03360.1 DNA adenine methylase [Bacteroidales bacterium]HPU47522.1 DNA adenine methylase [Bacteroidales bacterium]HQD35418.1 DNA adenine methylase [Bacteroidales bacterium]
MMSKTNKTKIHALYNEEILFPDFAPITPKDNFLHDLRGKKEKYKRYLGSPLRYAGGKSWAVGYVIEKLPDNIDRLISPFFGGGSIEIAIAKELGIQVLGFEIFDILVNYWKIQIEKPEDLYNELSKLNPTKETYNIIKEELKKHWEGKIKLPPLKLAAYYYFNHNLSYGPGFLGWMSSVYADKNMYQRLLERVKNFNVKNIKVECDSFENVIPLYKNDFLYCDPPYYLGGDSTVFKGLYPQRNFPIHHNNFNHELLKDLLLDHKGGFILSYNDTPTIRDWYKDFEIIELSINYTMGQGETRIGVNRRNKNANHIKETQELLIVKNY